MAAERETGKPNERAPGRPRGRRVDGELLRRRRHALALSREALAEKAGLHERTILRAERGARISGDSLRRIAEVLALTESDLMEAPAHEVAERLRRYGLAVPPPPEPWLARSAEAAQLIERLTGAERGLCCIAGPSGTGKTALARHVAQEIAAQFPHGVIWLKASSQGLAINVAQAQLGLAEALGFRQRLPMHAHVDEEAFTEAFAAEMWAHDRLLLMDDVLSPAVVSYFVPRDEAVPVLVTTRLRHVAERFGEHTVVLGGVGIEDTRRILVHYLGEARVHGGEDGVAVLHQLLAGVPRSIHMVGIELQRERLVTVREYAERLRRELEVPADAPAHSITPTSGLAALLAPVERQLSAEAGELLAALSVFGQACFTLDWAAAVGAVQSAELAGTLVSELVDAYLIVEQLACPPRDSCERCFRLSVHAELPARGRLGHHAPAVLERLVTYAAERTRVAGQHPHEGQAPRLAREAGMWRHVLELLTAAVASEEQPARAITSDPAAIACALPRELAAQSLVDIACSLGAGLAGEPHGERWLRAAITCARARGRDSDAERLREHLATIAPQEP